MPHLKDGYISKYSPKDVLKKYASGEYKRAVAVPHSDATEVRLDDSSIWIFTSSECCDLGINPVVRGWDLAEEEAPTSRETIHILYQGSPLCGFHQGRPFEWPEGHTWIPMAADMGKTEISTTKGCKQCFTQGADLFWKLYKSK